MTVEWWLPHAPGLLAREAQVQRMLHGGAVPVPRCVAVDPTGEVAGEPVLLMTRLQGRPLLDRGDDAVLSAAARVLVTIHATHVDDMSRPRPYQSWAGPGPWPVPAWARRPDVWERAAAVAAGPAPDFVGTFHRDFNPSNLLWSDVDGAAPSVTGVVDWVETSWGPADLDVAHCAKQLAVLHGPDAADHFVELYQEHGGRLAPTADQRAYWTALVGLATVGPQRALELWREQGLTRVGADDARARLEEHLARALRAG